MPTLTPTTDTGAQAKSSSLLYGPADRQVSDQQLAEQLQVDGLNTAFLADLLSGFLTHERCGRHLYRSVASRTHNPVLRRKYEHFGEETEHHAEVLERLVTGCGGNPSYISPLARAVEASDSKLIESTFLAAGSLDPMTAEMAMLDAVLIAESVDQANWQAMEQVYERLPEGQVQDDFRSAVAEVLVQEEEHLGWAHDMRSRLTLLQLRSSTVAAVGERMEEMVARIREWLS